MTPKFDQLHEGIFDDIKSAALPVAAAATMAFGGDAQGATRGVRNHNPGNIKKGQTWQGETKGTDKTFETFKSAEYGIRAIGITLRTYNMKHNLDTIDGVIKRWAPPSENKTTNYINFVAKQLGIKSNTKLKLFDAKGNINNRKALTALINAIIKMETSHTYPDKTIQGGINLITPAAKGKIVVYTIKSGDNLSKIAATYKTTLKKIQAANPQIKNINRIFPGQKINIPQ